MEETNKDKKEMDTKRVDTKKHLTAEEKAIKKDNKRAKKAAKKEKNNKSKVRRVLRIALRTFIILMIVGTLVGGGLVAGMFMGLFGDGLTISEEDLGISRANTYFYDSEGNQMDMIYSDENRMVVSYADMNPMLPQAYISIEDERFESHHGVDFKRTASATLSFLTHRGTSSFGGSTITQQLIKNITDEREDEGVAGITRKIKEMARAIQIEKQLSKNQIIEYYLNILFLGGDVYGVQTASYYYFDKPCKDLLLEECAFLAGITNSPNYYNPYSKENDNTERIKTRVKVVLNKMLELGKIDQTQHDESVARVNTGMTFKQGMAVTSKVQSYFVEAAMTDVILDLMKEKNIPYEFAQRLVYSGGYHIYTTQVPSVQSVLDETYHKEILFSKKSAKGQEPQSGMAVIDYTTGSVVGIAGGKGDKLANKEWNRAYSYVNPTDGKRHGMVRATGSTMKPLSVYAPAVEKKLITPASIYEDVRKTYKVGGTNWAPKNQYTAYKGFITVRTAVEVSTNTIPVQILNEMGVDASYTFLQSLGITSLDERDKSLSPLGLGGLTNGISPVEMAAGYGTIANDGKYITPKFYTKVTDSNGKTILEAKKEERQVMSPEAAYIMKNLLTQPVIGAGGTATYCKISGMDVAAKTGTTNDDFDRWLCGFTPYYSAATWFGYDTQETVPYIPRNPAGSIWIDAMKTIHTGLEGKKFVKPETVATSTVCRDSGMIPTDICAADPRGARAITDMFIKGTIPAEPCNMHVRVTICSETGLLPTEFCPHQEVVRLSNEYKWKDSNADLIAPTLTCTTHTSAPAPVVQKSNNAYLKEVGLGTDYKIDTKFSKDTLGPYTITVPSSVTNAQLTFKAEDTKAAITTSGSLNGLVVGTPVIYKVTVTAEDGTSKTYTFTIKRDSSSGGRRDTSVKIITQDGTGNDTGVNVNNNS